MPRTGVAAQQTPRRWPPTPTAPGPPATADPRHLLLKRVFDIDLVCADCGAKMHRIAHIEDPLTVARILEHLGLPTTLPPVAPARAPPQLDLDLGDGLFADGLPVFDNGC